MSWDLVGFSKDVDTLSASSSISVRNLQALTRLIRRDRHPSASWFSGPCVMSPPSPLTRLIRREARAATRPAPFRIPVFRSLRDVTAKPLDALDPARGTRRYAPGARNAPGNAPFRTEPSADQQEIRSGTTVKSCKNFDRLPW